MALAVGIDEDADGLCHADSIAELHEHFVCHACCHHVLGDVASCVGCRAVHLRGVLAAEGTTAVCALATIGVNNDFAACEACVAVRATNHELAGRVHVIGNVFSIAEKFLDALRANAFEHPWHKYLLDVLCDTLLHSLVGVELVVLSAHHDSVDTLRHALVAVFNRHLTLGIRTQVGHHLTLATDVGKHQKEAVRQVEAQGHVVLGLVGGIAEHHTLVASTLCGAVGAVNAAVDVRALLVNGREDTATVALEHVFALRVTNPVDNFTRDALQINVRFCLDFASHHHLTCGHECLASHLRVGVEGQQFVQNGVTDLIRHLVGMALGNGFRCKQITHSIN